MFVLENFASIFTSLLVQTLHHFSFRVGELTSKPPKNFLLPATQTTNEYHKTTRDIALNLKTVITQISHTQTIDCARPVSTGDVFIDE